MRTAKVVLIDLLANNYKGILTTKADKGRGKRVVNTIREIVRPN